MSAVRNTIVIPAYDAEATLARVVARIDQARIPDLDAIWIVDDGSRDGTAGVAEALAAVDPRIHVIRVWPNGGYGAAMKRGLAAAQEANASTVACVHADGQYAPELLGELLDNLHARDLVLLQGSRIASGGALSGGMPLYKYVGNRALTTLENRVFGMRMTDYHSGYLIYDAAALRTIPFADLSDRFDFDLEVIASARARGLPIGEYPIPTHYGDERSHLRSIPYGLRALRVMGRYLLGGYAPRAS